MRRQHIAKPSPLTACERESRTARSLDGSPVGSGDEDGEDALLACSSRSAWRGFHGVVVWRQVTARQLGRIAALGRDQLRSTSISVSASAKTFSMTVTR